MEEKPFDLESQLKDQFQVRTGFIATNANVTISLVKDKDIVASEFKTRWNELIDIINKKILQNILFGECTLAIVCVPNSNQYNYWKMITSIYDGKYSYLDKLINLYKPAGFELRSVTGGQLNITWKVEVDHSLISELMQPISLNNVISVKK